MILQNYSVSRAKKLSNFTVPDTAEPFEINILWLQNEDFDNRSAVFNDKLHRHTFFEMHFVLEGENIIRDGCGNSFSVKAGEAMILAPGSSHLTAESSGGLKRFSIAFLLPENSTVSRVFSSLDFYVYALSKKSLAVLDDIFLEINTNTILSPYIIRNKTLEIISEVLNLTKYKALFLQANPEAEDLRIEKAKKYIQDNSNLMLTCRDVANYCNFNEIYLNRIFKERTGETLTRYIQRKKVECGQELLRHTELSLTEIGSRLGFSNEYYFNSFFKRVSGIPPGAYRKQVLHNNNFEKTE